MARFNSLRSYARAINQGREVGERLRRNLQQELERIAQRWLETAYEDLRRLVYSRYIPSRQEYYATRRDRARGSGAGNRGEFPLGSRAFANEVLKTSKALAEKHGALTARAIEQAQGNRAWNRTGNLLDRSNWLIVIWTSPEANPIGNNEDAGVLMRNYARNERGSAYAFWRASLGASGHRKNSIWTQSGNWQQTSMDKVRKFAMARIRIAVLKAFRGTLYEGPQ